jgi:hypothetical protein
MTSPVSSTPARAPELGVGDAFLAAAGTAVRKATATAAKGVIDAVAATAANELGKAIVGSSSSKKSTSTKKTTKTTTKKTTAAPKGYATKPGEFDFLKDKSLSVEERLFRFMQLMSKKYESALDKKMNEIAAKQQKKKAEDKKSGGLFGGILGSVGSVIKAAVPLVDVAANLLGNKAFASLLKEVSGPVLAAGAVAFGVPQLAPLLAQLGPDLVAAVPELAGRLGLGDDASATKTSGSASSKSGDPEMSQADQMELQRIMEKQKEMFATISAVLKSMHDTKMSIIGNIR